MATKKKAAAKKTKEAADETKATKIVELLKAGKTAKEISVHGLTKAQIDKGELFCRRGYVYIVREEHGIAKPKKEKKEKVAKAKKAPVKKAAKAPAKKAAVKPVAKKAEDGKKSDAVAKAQEDAKAKLPIEEKKLEDLKARYTTEQNGQPFTKAQSDAIAAQTKKISNLNILIKG